VAVNPPATRVAAVTPSQPTVAATPVAASMPVTAAAPPADRGVAVLAMPPTAALPPPDVHHLPQAQAQAEVPAQTPVMNAERAATEAAALTAAIPLPDPLPLPFVNRAVPIIGAGSAAPAQRSSAATTHSAFAPRIAAATGSVAPVVETPVRPIAEPALSQATPDKKVAKVAAKAAVGHGTKKVATRSAKSRHPRTVASRHSRSRHPEKVATRRGRTRAAQKHIARKHVAQKHVAGKNVVARRNPAVRPAQTAAHNKRERADRLAERNAGRSKPVATPDKARAVVAPAEAGGGTPSQGGWVGPLAPGSATKVGVTHSSALERPRTGFALASAAERIRASSHDRAKTARATAHRPGADGPGRSVRLADSG
jgi:hypothetical protein